MNQTFVYIPVSKVLSPVDNSVDRPATGVARPIGGAVANCPDVDHVTATVSSVVGAWVVVVVVDAVVVTVEVVGIVVGASVDSRTFTMIYNC